MRRKKLIIILLFFFIFSSFMSLNAQWARTYGGSSNDYAYSIQQTTDGGCIVAGDTYSFGAGYSDIWILKLSSTGAIEWQKAYGGSSNDFCYYIQQTSDGGYIVAGETSSFGAGYSDIWILKLSSTGAIEWQRTYGGMSYDYPSYIQQTSDGGYIVAGETDSFSVGSYDIWILKLSSTGAIEWQRTYGGTNFDYAWEIQQTNDGGYIVAAQTWSFGAGQDDALILKLGSAGAIEWQLTYGGFDRDWASTTRQTSDGGYIVVCGTRSFGAGDWDFWILKLSSTGAISWQRTYGGINSDWCQACLPISDGGYIVTGRTSSFGAGGYDAWVLNLSSNGDINWQRTYGGINSESAAYPFIQQGSDGGYMVPGWTSSFDAGGYDAWVLKLYPDGDIAPSCGFIGISNATVINTYILPASTCITSMATNVNPMSTDVSPLDTNASSILLCEAPKYTLTVSAGNGGSTFPVPGNYTHYWRRTVSITAGPNIGYRFSGWSGDASGTTNPITITMDSDKSITANFIRQYTLTIAAGTGGTTNPSPGTYTHDSGTQVSITSTPNSGYRFSGWSGDASGTTNPITITMDNDKSVTASFTAIAKPPEEGKKGGCFIATAAYGSPLHPHVNILRDFRDEYLMPTKVGRALVGLYYKYSPSVADLIAKYKVLKVYVRISLLPMIAFSYSMVHFGPIITAVMLVFIFVLPVFLVSFFRRKLK